jgi:hypothetical protein
MVNPARSWLAWVALSIAAGSALAQSHMASEAAVKAAFLHKFLGYIEWSPGAFASADAPIVVATAGSDDVSSELDRIAAARPVLGRRVVVRKLAEGDRFAGVHVLFVARGEPATRGIVRQAREQGLITVTETERGLEMGSAINFTTAEDRVGFEVALDAVERSGHRLSSRMLAVARRVVPKP